MNGLPAGPGLYFGIVDHNIKEKLVIQLALCPSFLPSESNIFDLQQQKRFCVVYSPLCPYIRHSHQQHQGHPCPLDNASTLYFLCSCCNFLNKRSAGWPLYAFLHLEDQWFVVLLVVLAHFLAISSKEGFHLFISMAFGSG